MTSSNQAIRHPHANSLYKEVKNRLMRGLVAGEWKPGQPIPSEWRLAERYDVSVGTVRRAIDELVAEKIVQRRQGSGPFVCRSHNRWTKSRAALTNSPNKGD